jgi:putative addiction module CopG family antidote
MPTRNINLTEHSDRFVNQKVTPGRYKSVSKIFGAALRLLEHHAQTDEQKLCRTSQQRPDQRDRPSTVPQALRPSCALSPTVSPTVLSKSGWIRDAISVRRIAQRRQNFYDQFFYHAPPQVSCGNFVSNSRIR